MRLRLWQAARPLRALKYRWRRLRGTELGAWDIAHVFNVPAKLVEPACYRFHLPTPRQLLCWVLSWSSGDWATYRARGYPYTQLSPFRVLYLDGQIYRGNPDA